MIPITKPAKDLPDFVDDRRSVRETSITEPPVPIEEEPEPASMRLSITMSCAVRERLQGGQ
jgi:hypothetical protein